MHGGGNRDMHNQLTSDGSCRTGTIPSASEFEQNKHAAYRDQTHSHGSALYTTHTSVTSQ